MNIKVLKPQRLIIAGDVIAVMSVVFLWVLLPDLK